MAQYLNRRAWSVGVGIAIAWASFGTASGQAVMSGAPQASLAPSQPMVMEGAAVAPGQPMVYHGGGGCCPKHHVCHHARWQAHKAKCQDKYIGYPEEFVARPLGAALYDAMKVQVSNGDASRMVIYDFDFQPGTNRLNVKGLDRLAQIANLAGSTFHPIVIERTPTDTQLAESRRLAVLSVLARSSPIPIPSERVVIGAPIANGLDGPSGVLIFQNLTSRTQQTGPPVNTVFGFTPR